MKHLARLTLLACLLTCTGCGTMIAFDRMPAAYPGCRPGLVYGGTQTDIMYGPDVIVSVLDIPLSLVADTLLLPYTISMAHCPPMVALPQEPAPQPPAAPPQPKPASSTPSATRPQQP